MAIEQPRGSLMPRCPLFVRIGLKLRKHFGIAWKHSNLSGPLVTHLVLSLLAELDGILWAQHAETIDAVRFRVSG